MLSTDIRELMDDVASSWYTAEKSKPLAGDLPESIVEICLNDGVAWRPLARGAPYPILISIGTSTVLLPNTN